MLKNHDKLYYSTFNCPFESGKCEKKKEKNVKKVEYLENKRSF